MMASPTRPRSAKPPMIARFRVFGYSFAIESRSETAIRVFRGLYRAHAVDETDPKLPTFRIGSRSDEQGRCWEVCPDSQPPAVFRSLGAALNRLEYEVCVKALTAGRGFLALHGATILTDRGAAFISGRSGAGKTTLSLALTTRGYRIGGDDMAMFDPTANAIQPMPRCFHIDARSRRLLRTIGAKLPGEGAKHGFVTPADLGIVAPPPAPIRWLIRLEAGDGPSPCLKPISQAEIMAILLSETPRGPLSPAEALPIFKRLAAGADCRQLVRGRLADTVETVCSLIGKP